MIFPDPLLQLGFSALLESARDRVLLPALRSTVLQLPTQQIDNELAKFVSPGAIAILASHGLRGETIFPVPIILKANPSLLGYYRLLYGYSQKQFYTTKTGASCLRNMEIKGTITPKAAESIDNACSEFARAGEMLVQGLGSRLSRAEIPHELSLLTLGAQFRGGANNTKGSDGIKAVFAVLKGIFENELEDASESSLKLKNAVGRMVNIQLASDPDVLVKTTMADGQLRSVVAIEVKAGEDHSNIWNRVGEAEKSHVNAKADGINERWTIVNDPQAPLSKLKSSSPSTTRFYQLLDLLDDNTDEFQDFLSRMRDLVGL